MQTDGVRRRVAHIDVPDDRCARLDVVIDVDAGARIVLACDRRIKQADCDRARVGRLLRMAGRRCGSAGGRDDDGPGRQRSC
jgi:hypothetical protein